MGPAGFTKSSMTASASWRAWRVRACGCSPAMGMISPHGFRSRSAAVTALPAHSFLIDGEAICTDEGGLAVFELIRRVRHGGNAVLCVFDLIELEGEDGRSVHWVKVKNPKAPAVKREAEEDWR